ncbi:Structural maintenance of chromosomes protein 5 [Rhodosporidiobolus nylandii]
MESSASPPQVKPEPNGASRARRRSSAVEDGADSDANFSDEDAHQAKRVKHEQKGKGKARVQDDEEDEDGEEQEQQEGEGDDGEDQPPEEEIDYTHEKQQLVRDDSGYVTGSIVRIACRSFLTYDFVEFRPGPALNMIIGPNGTGKSTIACAIAIGLGFPAKVLGRSTKVSQYCKNDSNEQTWIEIELKGRPGKKNLTVKRYLSRDSEKTRFKLNDNDATAAEVAEHMEELQVQVGNLCTFLPQDRVASFAMMSPSELLKETQKTAGHPKLYEWHQLLIEEYKKLREAQGDVDRLSEKHKRLTTKQAEADKEVKAFERREQLEQDLQVVDISFKFAQYLDVYNRHQQAKQDKVRVQNEVRELEAKNKPFKESKARLRDIVKVCEKEQEALQKKVSQATKDASSKEARLAGLDDEVTKVKGAIDDIKKDEEMRKENMKRYQKEIDRYEPLVANEPPETDTRESEKTHERNGVVGELQANSDRQEQIKQNAQGLKGDLEQQQRILQQLNQLSRQRELNMEKFDKDGWTATQWLRENKHRMKGEVFEPARLFLTIKSHFNGQRLDLRDSELVNLVEGPIPMSAMSSFLFEKREDYDFLHNVLVDEPNRQRQHSGLKINGNEIDINAKVADIPRPCSPEELNALGFDCYAIDLVDAPEPVLVWMCQAHKLHLTPVQLRRRPVDERTIEQRRLFQRYFTRDGSTSIRFSNYGKRLSQTEQRALPGAKILAVDQARVDSANKRIAEISAQRGELKGEIDQLRGFAEELQAQIKQIEDERNELVREKDNMGKARSTWMKAQSKLNMARSGLEKERNKPTADEKRNKLNQRLRGIMEKRVRLVVEWKEFVDRAADKQEQSIKMHLQALQADSDHRAMESMVREKDEELVEKQEELEQVKTIVSALAQEGKQYLQAAEEANAAASEEVKQLVRDRRDENGDEDIDALDTARTEIQSNLDCMANVSPQVLQQYNKRKAEIADYEGKLAVANEALNESKAVIDETKARWLPRLQRLVNDVSEKFSSSFDTLGLLGEVRLAQHDDYEKWGIEIMVSFRDRNDDNADFTLHVLSAHRQSGGERALSTVTYLLALAELARAPFALVDEINQGMDQRAERNMHKMLVETTCKDDVGQYFLLTPKLLPDLVYHPKMKVLVINVSPWIPDRLSLGDILKKKNELNQKRASGSGRAIAAA